MVSLRVSVNATRAAAHFREQFPHLCAGGVGKKILLQAPSVAEEKFRGPLINDVSSKQVKRALNALAEHCEQLTILGSFPIATISG